jgi:hypothetical protein
MPADTAWTKLAAKVKQVLQDAATGAGRTINIFTSADRSDMDALGEADLPGVVIGMGKVDFEYAEHMAQMRHTGVILFSVQSGIETGLHIDPSNQDAIAFIVEALAASDYLDGWVEFLDPVSMDASEQAAPNVGEALLTMTCTLYTPTGDFRTIIGTDGTPH